MKFTKKLALGVTVMMAVVAVGCGGGGEKKAAVKYPTKPINLIVPYAAGGSSDLSARPFANELHNILKQPVVVVNKPGAGGGVGASEVARAKDGYTLLNASIGNVTIVPYTANVGYDYKSFKPVAQMTDIPLALAVKADSPIKTAKDFVDYVKANPGKFRIGNPGAGNIQHVSLAGFCKKNGLDVVHTPYAGANPAISALLGGHVEGTFTGITEALPHVKSGAFRVLGVTSAERSSLDKSLPTFKEQGYDFDASVWYGVLAPAGTPDADIKILEEACKKAYEAKTVQDGWAKLYLIPAYLDSKAFTARIEKQAKENEATLKDLGLAKK